MVHVKCDHNKRMITLTSVNIKRHSLCKTNKKLFYFRHKGNIRLMAISKMIMVRKMKK